MGTKGVTGSASVYASNRCRRQFILSDPEGPPPPVYYEVRGASGKAGVDATVTAKINSVRGNGTAAVVPTCTAEGAQRIHLECGVPLVQ